MRRMAMSKVYVGLLHYPVYNRRMETITTSITNLDLHDIARVAATYELDGYFVIQPDDSQRQLAESVLSFWRTEEGKEYNADRYQAFKRLVLIDTLEHALESIQTTSEQVYVVVTDAKPQSEMITYEALRRLLRAEDEAAYLLLFGTGWGISREIMERADNCLPPILGRGSYNHLSVRSAAAITIDRLLGEIY